MEGRVDLGQVVRLEHGLDHYALDLLDAPDRLVGAGAVLALLLLLLLLLVALFGTGFQNRSSPSAQALGTRDDFHDLLRDVCLALSVRLESEVVDQLGCVV